MDRYARARMIEDNEAELARLRADIAEREQRLSDQDWEPPTPHMVYKTHDQQPSQNNDGGWNAWADTKIAAAIERDHQLMIEVVGDALGEFRAQLRKEFEAKLGELRADIAVLQGILRGEVRALPQPTKDAGDAA